MKKQTLLFMLFMFQFSHSLVAISQDRLTGTGDRLTYEFIQLSSADNKTIRYTRTLELSQDGDRTHWYSDKTRKNTFDRDFTLIESPRGKVEKDEQFARVPIGVEVGKKWKTSYRYPNTAEGCGTGITNYDAAAESGPDFSVVMDGKETIVKTIQINYKGWWRCSHATYSGRIESEIIYSPSLNEILSYFHTQYTPQMQIWVQYKTVLKGIQRPKGAATK